MVSDAGMPPVERYERPPTFRVLGVLEIDDGGQPHAMTAGRARIVLAMLLLEPRRVLPVDRLIQAVWQDDPPPTARGQIQICVSGLRKQFGQLGLGELIQTYAPGYLLDLAPEQIDLHRFELQAEEGLRAAAQNELTAASGILADALALWRGPAMSGIESEVVRAATAGLAERRLAVFEAYAKTELRLGHGGMILGRIAEFTAENPLTEGLTALQMAALFNSGRQADALRVYRKARRRLVDELAIEPGRELRELERAILRDDLSHPLLGSPRQQPAAIGWCAPSRTTFQVPEASTGVALIGRDAELDELLEQLRHGQSPLAVVTGISGSGKTRLAAECALRWQPGPYRYIDAGALDEVELLRQIRRSLGVGDDAGNSWVSCRRSLAENPVLLVLDGLCAQAVLDRLAPPAYSAGALLVVSPVALSVPAGALVLQLSALRPEQSLAMLAANAGLDRVDLHLASALQLIEATAGHPGVLTTYATELDNQPGLSLPDLAADVTSRANLLGEELTAGLVANCTQLDADARMLLRRLAILPAGGFGAWVAAPLLDRSEARAVPALQELVAVGLAEGRGPRYELVRPVWDFARLLLGEEENPAAIDAAERRLLSATLGRLAMLERPVTALPIRSVLPDCSGQATGGEALDRSWLDQNAALLRVAVERAAALGRDELCWQLGFLIASLLESEALLILGDHLLQLASAAAVRADDRRGQAAMLQVSARSRAHSADPDGARAKLRVAVELFQDLGEEAAACRLRRELAELQLDAGELDAAIAGLRQCITRAAQLGDLADQALCLLALNRALLAGGQPAAAQRCRNRLERLLDSCTDSRLRQHVTTGIEALPGHSAAMQPSERTWA